MEREENLMRELQGQGASRLDEREKEIREWAEKRIADKENVVQQLRAQIGVSRLSPFQFAHIHACTYIHTC